MLHRTEHMSAVFFVHMDGEVGEGGRCCSRLRGVGGGGVKMVVWGCSRRGREGGDGSQNHSLMTPGPSPRCAGGAPETPASLINKLLICTKAPAASARRDGG